MKAQTFIMLTGAAMAAALLFAGCVSNPATEAERNGATAQDAPITLDREEVKQETRENDAIAPAPNDESVQGDYSIPDRWIATGGDKSKGVDIFLATPTGTVSSGSFASFADAKSSATSWQSQVQSLFRNETNIYHAVYRYACIFGCSGGSGSMDGLATRDIIAAFDYYWKNYNKGERPFILFGFSQGAYVLWNLVSQYIDNDPEVQKYHIVTYALGSPGRGTAASSTSTVNRLMSQSATDLNKVVCYAAYNETTTNIGFARGNGQHITNPLTWTTDDTYEPCTVDGVNRCNGDQILGAKVDYTKRALVVRVNPNASRQPTESNVGINMGFHSQEYVWFASSITQNIKDRTAAWNAAYGTSSIREPERIVR